MKLSDVMSGLGLAGFPIVAMALFLAVFVGVVLTVLSRSRRAEFDRAAMLPLEDPVNLPPASQREVGQ